MCSRYVSPDEAAIEREWNLTRIRNQIKIPNWNVSPRYPSARDQAQRCGPPLKDKTAPSSSRRASGLIPFWAKGAVPKFGTIMATCEPL